MPRAITFGLTSFALTSLILVIQLVQTSAAATPIAARASGTIG